ncbi:MAG TPA: hypothetical protein VFW73_10115 [Lacipirellulaceae bacterium]|nr:hypothetical protein [Lacipirellulaceae bacterium]
MFLILIGALAFVAGSAGSFAEQNARTATHESKAKHETPSAPAPDVAAPDAAIPDGPTLNMLIRRTLLTLNDANLSGNYTVMRDLAAPGFQAGNDAAKLTDIFANLRKRQIDLAPILFFDPKLVRQPEITQNGMLHLSGFIPTRPEQVNFDMLFEKTGDRWRLFGIAVNTSVAQTATKSPEQTERGEKKSSTPKPEK